MNWLKIIPIAIFAMLAGLFLVALGRDDSGGLPSALVGKGTPEMSVVPLAGYAPITPDMLAAPRVKVVNFWASWCLPCRAEHPSLLALSDLGINVLGVNYKDDPANAQGFLDELGNPFAAIGADQSGRTGLDWGIYGVPETFVIGKDGTVKLRFAGPVTAEILQNRILPAIAKAEAEPDPNP